MREIYEVYLNTQLFLRRPTAHWCAGLHELLWWAHRWVKCQLFLSPAVLSRLLRVTGPVTLLHNLTTPRATTLERLVGEGDAIFQRSASSSAGNGPG